MAYDIMAEAMQAIKRGDLSIEDFMNQYEQLTSAWLINQAQDGNGKYSSTVKSTSKLDGGEVEMKVTATVTKGLSSVMAVREKSNEVYEDAKAKGKSIAQVMDEVEAERKRLNQGWNI